MIDGDLELGVISYDPEDERLVSHGDLHRSPGVRRLAQASAGDAAEVSISELGEETFIAHNVVSPYRAVVLKEFQRHKVPLNMDVEMPTVETIRKMVQRNEGVAFLPRMCVEQDVAQDCLREIKVKEMDVDRKIRLVYPAKRSLSHAAKAFLELVKGG